MINYPAILKTKVSNNKNGVFGGLDNQGKGILINYEGKVATTPLTDLISLADNNRINILNIKITPDKQLLVLGNGIVKASNSNNNSSIQVNQPIS